VKEDEMAADNRPLSPHLQIYRPQITSVLSISHRFSGLALALAFLGLVWWLAAAAAGGETYAGAMAVITGGFGRLVAFLASYAFFYHLSNGIRHLFWDAGRGFEIRQVYASGYAVIGASLVLTLVFWGLVLAGGGA